LEQYRPFLHVENHSTPPSTTQPGLKLQHNKDIFHRREETRDTHRQIKS
jgi:hypothetical protein